MANYLEREAKAKKEARKAKNTKKRTTIEQMDSTLEEIMKETNIEGKIKELEAELKEAQKTAEGSREKATAIGEDKKRRDEKGQAKFDEYRKGIEKNANQAEAKSAAIARKLQFYKAFKENGKQILNIRDYQLGLQKRLETLESKKKTLAQGQKDIEKIDVELNRIEKAFQELMAKRREVERKLRDSKTPSEERAKLEEERAKISSQIDENNKKYTETQSKRDEMQMPDKKDVDKVSAEITSTQITISKCNMIWMSLLKGKNWDEIEAILQKEDFTAKKGTIDKIRDLSKTKEEANKEVNLDEVQAEAGRNVSQILDGTGTEIGEDGGNGEEQRDKEQEGEGEKNELPAEVKSFAERHPRLAKIPGLAKMMDKRAEKKREKAKKKEEEAKDEGKRRKRISTRHNRQGFKLC